jgi:hypothetical protein
MATEARDFPEIRATAVTRVKEGPEVRVVGPDRFLGAQEQAIMLLLAQMEILGLLVRRALRRLH